MVLVNSQSNKILSFPFRKATTAEALIPTVLAEKLILVGDHRQLRPMLTANREVEKWLRGKFKTDTDEFDSWDDYFNRPSLFGKNYLSKILISSEPHRKTFVEQV